MKKTLVLLSLFSLFFLFTGCGVPEAEHREVASELASLKSQVTRYKSDNAKLTEKLNSLEAENKKLKARIGKLLSAAKDQKATAAAASSVKKQQPTPQPKSAGTYKVKRGDTLWGISKRLGVSVGDITRLNKINNNQITVGQTLKLP